VEQSSKGGWGVNRAREGRRGGAEGEGGEEGREGRENRRGQRRSEERAGGAKGGTGEVGGRGVRVAEDGEKYGMRGVVIGKEEARGREGEGGKFVKNMGRIVKRKGGDRWGGGKGRGGGRESRTTERGGQGGGWKGK